MSIIQTSCSELLVDTAIHDPKIALERFTKLFKDLEWESSPPLTLEVLESIKKQSESSPDEYGLAVTVYDSKGNRASLQYGDNGYVHTGYRFDSECNHGDELCYPIFYEAIERMNGELISCDGGDTNYYYEWESKKDEADSD